MEDKSVRIVSSRRLRSSSSFQKCVSEKKDTSVVNVSNDLTDSEFSSKSKRKKFISNACELKSKLLDHEEIKLISTKELKFFPIFAATHISPEKSSYEVLNKKTNSSSPQNVSNQVSLPDDNIKISPKGKRGRKKAISKTKIVESKETLDVPTLNSSPTKSISGIQHITGKNRSITKNVCVEIVKNENMETLTLPEVTPLFSENSTSVKPTKSKRGRKKKPSERESDETDGNETLAKTNAAIRKMMDHFSDGLLPLKIVAKPKAPSLSSANDRLVPPIKSNRGRNKKLSKSESDKTESKETLEKSMNDKQIPSNVALKNNVSENQQLVKKLQNKSIVTPKFFPIFLCTSKVSDEFFKPPTQLLSSENISTVHKKVQVKRKKRNTNNDKKSLIGGKGTLNETNLSPIIDDAYPKKRSKKDDHVSDVSERNILSYRRTRKTQTYLENDFRDINEKDLNDVDGKKKVSKHTLKSKSKQALASIKKAKRIVNKIKQQQKNNIALTDLQVNQVIENPVVIKNNVNSKVKLFPIFSSGTLPSVCNETDVSKMIQQNQESETKKEYPSCKKNDFKTSKKLNSFDISKDETKLKKSHKKQQIIHITLCDDQEKIENDIEIIEPFSIKLVASKDAEDVLFKKVSTKLNIPVELDLVCYPTYSHYNPTYLCKVAESSESNLNAKCDGMKNPFVNLSNNFDQVLKEHSINEIKYPKSTDLVNELNKNNDHCVKIPIWDKSLGLLAIDFLEHLSAKKEDVCLNVEPNRIDVIKSNQNLDDKKHKLWTDFTCNLEYKCSSNELVVNEIKSWLLDWKNKFNKGGKNQDEDSLSSFSSDSYDSDCSLSNSIIISGKPASGKTSLVYTLAHELGFKVLEVNASTCRSGRNISLRLKEALESYHVENIEVNKVVAKSECKDNTNCRIEDVKNSVISECSSKNESKKRTKRKAAKKSKMEEDDDCKIFECDKNENIKSYFKAVSESSNQKQVSKNIINFFDSGKFASHTKSDKTLDLSNVAQKEKLYKISGLTIILFDDVDVVFEEDEGFWTTVKGFLKISKKPVIFTVSRNIEIVKANLNLDLKVFHLNPMPESTTVEKLKTITKQYVEPSNINFQLLSYENGNDLRKSLLHAQFWTQKCGRTSSIVKNYHSSSFILGTLNFTTNEIDHLLFSDSLDFPPVISDYHKMGYDLLHGNLFSLFNISDQGNIQPAWKESSKTKKPFSDSEDPSKMWEEACEVFKAKKKALQSGSSSELLNAYATIFENFSFADTLIKSSDGWLSASERVRKWTDGLPTCSESTFWNNSMNSDIVSVIHFYNLRNGRANASKDLNSKNVSANMHLEHSVNHCGFLKSKTEEQVLSTVSALPLTQYLNKSAISLDYLNTLKIICNEEKLRQSVSAKRSGRFLHYFDSISLFIDKSRLLTE